MHHIFHYYFSLREHKLYLLQHYQLLALPFHCHRSPNWYQWKWTTSYLPCWPKNQIKLLIVLREFKALPEGYQQIYTKNATSQGLVFIQRQNDYRTIENLVTWLPANFYWYRAYLTTINWPLKGNRSLNAIASTFFTLHPNLLSILCLLRQSNEGSARLPWD